MTNKDSDLVRLTQEQADAANLLSLKDAADKVGVSLLTAAKRLDVAGLEPAALRTHATAGRPSRVYDSEDLLTAVSVSVRRRRMSPERARADEDLAGAAAVVSLGFDAPEVTEEPTEASKPMCDVLIEVTA